MFKSKVNNIDHLQKSNGDYEIRLEVPKGYHINELKKAMETADYVELKKYQAKRSLNANAALWEMLTKLAPKLGTTKEELYVRELERYGTLVEHIAVPENSVDRIRQVFRHVINRGKVSLNGKENIHLECYYGTSHYDKEAFSILLDGVIEDAKEQGVEFISSEEKDRLLEEIE